jgi:DNA repair protein RadC
MQYLSDFELLGCIIGEWEAKRLYKGSLIPLFFPSSITGSTHRRLVAAHELVKRLLCEEIKRGPALNHPGAVKLYLQALFAGKEVESFVLLLLDTQHRLITVETISQGTIDGASVYPREVVKAALRCNAAAVLLSHNHPSGVAEPSTADRLLTDRLRDALRLVDVRVLDHFVVGGTTVTSMAERGWL